MRFRNYCNSNPIVLESKKFMAQNATLRGEVTPLPGPMDFSTGRMPKDLQVSVANVLNLLPPSKRASALKWIMGDAAEHAASSRAKIAEWAKHELLNRFGFNPNWSDETWEEAVFNKQAYQEFPELGKIAKEIEEKWFSDPDNEPDIIPIKDSRSTDEQKGSASLRHINAMLLRDGKTPLFFGGQNGYLSYIEKGSWNRKKISRATNFGNQGHDMSLRRTKDYSGRMTDPVTNTQFVSLGNAGKSLLASKNDDEYVAGEKYQGGYNPISNLSTLDSELSRSERLTRRMLDKIANDIESGVEIQNLDHADVSFLKQMIKDKKLNPEVVNDEDMLLSAILGLKNKDARKEVDDESGEAVPWIRVGGTDQDYLMAKASVKASLEFLLKQSPGKDVPGKALGNDHSSNPWPWPSIRINGAPDGKIDLNPEDPNRNIDNPEVFEKVLNQMMGLIFNDKDRTVLKRFAVMRNGVGGIKKWTRIQKNGSTKIPISDLITGKGDVAKFALKSRGEKPIVVSINGKEVPVNPADLLGKQEPCPKCNKKGAGPIDPNCSSCEGTGFVSKTKMFRSRNYRFKGEFAPIFMQSEISQTYTEDEMLQLAKDNKYQVGGNNKTFVTMWFKGSSDIRKFVKLVDGRWGEIVTSKGTPIDPSTNLRYLDKYQTLAIANIKGNEVLVKKVKTPTGDQWIEMPPGVKTDDAQPIMTSIKPNFNVAGGIHDKMEYPPDQQEKQWNYFMNNLDKFNDRLNKEFNKAQSIVHGVKSGNQEGRKGYDASQLMNEGEIAVRSHLANQSFRYGTPEILLSVLSKTPSNSSDSDSPDAIQMPTAPVGYGQNVQRPTAAPAQNVQRPTASSLDDINSRLSSALGLEHYSYTESDLGVEDKLLDALYFGDENADQKKFIDLYKKVVFGMAGEVEQHDGPPKVVGKTLYVNSDLLNAILDSGYIWRKRKAAAAAVSAYYASPKAQSVGSGGGSKGGDSEEMDLWANVADDEDDEFSKQRSIDSGESDYDDYDDDTRGLSVLGSTEMDMDSEDDTEKWLRDQSKGRRSMLTRGYSSKKELPTQNVKTNSVEDQLNAAIRSVPMDISILDKKIFGESHTNLKTYSQWLTENEAIHDPKVKIGDGCGFNWWGAAGNPLGVSISGKADTSKSDPTGKAKNGKSRISRK